MVNCKAETTAATLIKYYSMHIYIDIPGKFIVKYNHFHAISNRNNIRSYHLWLHYYCVYAWTGNVYIINWYYLFFSRTRKLFNDLGFFCVRINLCVFANFIKIKTDLQYSCRTKKNLMEHFGRTKIKNHYLNSIRMQTCLFLI